ncbi:MAG: hypothetical protein AAB456_04305, partial [Patescibacteria group bacterium]
MPAVVALAIRSLIQITVTLGLVTLAEKYVFPLVNRGIAAIMEVFGVSEEDAKDIMSNEIILFAESVAVGGALLKTKLPTKIAERLGFTSKGFGKRILSGKAANVRTNPISKTIIIPGQLPVPTAAEAAVITSKAISVLKGAAAAFNFLMKPLKTTFIGFLVFNNLVDFGNWNNGAYQKTFQKIFAAVTFGLLVPDADYRTTKTTSPAVFDKVFNTYKIEGVHSINDPFKGGEFLFTRDNLIDLLDKIGAELLRTTQKASTKDVLLASQLFMVFPFGEMPGPGLIPAAKAATIPQIKVFTGILTQGKLGEREPFVGRETDLIDSIDELQSAAANNLTQLIAALPGRIIYEIKIVSSITTKDGFIKRGQSQTIQSGSRKDGTPLFKTVINKFAVVDVFVFTERNVRTKIQRIVLGPVDSIRFQPKPNELQIAEQTIKANLTTSDTSEINKIISENPVTVEIAPQLPDPTLPAEPALPVSPVASGATGPVVGVQKAAGETFTDWIIRTGFNPVVITKDFQPGYDPNTDQNFTANIFNPPGQEAPVSTNPNKCFAKTIAEFFDAEKKKYPSVEERSINYESYGLGPKDWYTGTGDQNVKLLTEFKKRSG